CRNLRARIVIACIGLSWRRNVTPISIRRAEGVLRRVPADAVIYSVRISSSQWVERALRRASTVETIAGARDTCTRVATVTGIRLPGSSDEAASRTVGLVRDLPIKALVHSVWVYDVCVVLVEIGLPCRPTVLPVVGMRDLAARIGSCPGIAACTQ